MHNPVIIIPAPDGSVIRVSEKNPEYGSVRVEQEVIEFNDRGFAGSKNRVAFIRGELSFLHKMNFKGGQVLPGRIVVKETLQPIDPNNLEYGLKKASKDGPVCRVDDEPIYRNSFYTEDSKIEDEFIKHTNTAEIRLAAKERREQAVGLE